MGADEVAKTKGDVVESADADALVIDGGPEIWVGADDQVYDTVEVGVQIGENLEDRLCEEETNRLL